jgi:hypothetical protein
MFQILLSSDLYWSRTGMTKNARDQLKHRFKNGPAISLDKKIDLLEKAGFTIAQPIAWAKPKL